MLKGDPNTGGQWGWLHGVAFRDRAEMVEKMLTKAVHPGCGRGSGQELEEIGLGEGWGDLRTQRSCLLGDAVKFTAEAGDFIKGGGVGRVEVHARRPGEGV
jgi:hypothetical protein